MPDAKPPLLMPPEEDDIEAIRASSLFDAEWYQKTYPDVKALGLDPAEHYLWLGVHLERRPSKDFDPARYLRLNGEVAAAGLNPLLHYERTRAKQNGSPNTGSGETGLASHSSGIEAIRVVQTHPAPAIIVPIYNAPECVEHCIRSVLHHTNQDFRLILVDDASPDRRVQDLLWQFAGLPNVTIAGNASNLGYTATVNRGISLAGEADVVLLNSDTVVTPLWLRNLQLAAYSADRVATATPFSDNAGAFSAPRMGEPNAIPEQPGLDAYARLVTRTAARLYPEVPTGNGFCMYVRRACIDEIGAFDAEAFPRGYGEENDFCLRASAAGWKHVVDDATLVHHVRSASFGAEGDTLRQEARAVVDRRYPEYPQAVQAMLADPLLDRARRNVDGALQKAVSGTRVLPRILFVISTTSGGTPRTNEDLMKALDDRAEAFVLQCDSRVIQLFEASGGDCVEVARHDLRTPTRAFPHRSEEYDAVLRTWLVRYAFESVHIRHIAWHSLGLVDEARRLGLPVIFSFHDYYTVCPTVKLLDDQMAYCGGRCTPGAGRCQMELWDTDEYPGLKHKAVHDWRKQIFDALTGCSAFVTTSAAARNGIVDAFPSLQNRRFEIIPHGRDFSRFDQPQPSWQDHEPLRLLVPGHILPAKGQAIVAELGRRAAQLNLELHILGTIDPAIEATDNVVLHGGYERDEFTERVEQIKPHVAGIFSIWPETFCHTLTELWACGIPVVAFDTGAVADRIRVHGGGWLCDLGDLQGLSRRLVSIRPDRAGYRRKLQDIRRWQVAEGRVHTTTWMAERYWDMYTQLSPGLSPAPETPALVIEAAMRRLAGAQAVAVAPDDTIEARRDARQMPSAAHWRAYANAVLSPATRGSVFERKLLAILQEDTPIGVNEALMASEAALQRASARMLKKDQRPLVSIVMPTYNRADVVDDAIQSIIEQDYGNWQLFVCDDASTDDTESVVARFHDDRINYLKLPKGGAAVARNAGLARAQGDIIAYLDSDNCWHPRYLSRMVLVLLDRPGHSAVYGNFIDYMVDEPSGTSIRSFVRPHFDQERLLRRNYIDLNTFVHRRELYDAFGGFNEALTRRQDYHLIIKYTWLRDPFRTREILALYQRNPSLRQITTEAGQDDSCVQIIGDSISQYLASSLPTAGASQRKRVTILSWDLCRNHFSKPFALAEALSESHDVQLVSFRFFDEEIFPPLKDVSPRFETVYLQGSRFPDFFEAMDKAVEAIDGDVIYVVKPRLPSLGTALLANARRGTPIILEINDLETVVASPTANDRHRETAFDSVDLAEPELLNPYSDPWSHIMDPIAKELPVLATHNKFIDAHFGHRCLYMRNLKDEAVYDPALYDREAVRAELGFAPDDRIILFGGMVRRHKGVYELIDLVERLGDARYKLLFVGSRETPDQRQLVEKFGDRVRVLPPQDRTAMARINLAADLVILWLDPDVPASHAQMPYKATDALAMKTPIIANDISDLGDLGRQGYLRLVPFGDWDAMARTIDDLFFDEARTTAMRQAGRRLYLRQFSYAAARADFALMLHRVQALDAGPLPAASAFARRFDEFRRIVTGASAPPAPSEPPAPKRLKIDGHGEVPEDASIVALDVTALDRLSHRDPDGVAIVMPSIDTGKALAAARLLVRRAGLKTTVFIVEDTLRQGFIRTLNATAARLDVKYVVYLAEDAFPGVDWLKLAHEQLEESGKGLLAFNCGKWKGRIAAFGMVRTEWVRKLYGGPIFHSGYKAHKADNELTVIARVTDQFVYVSDSVLIEIDAGKVFKENVPEDKSLFHARFRGGFDGLADMKRLEPLADDYFVPLTAPSRTTKPRPLPPAGNADAGLIAEPLGPSAIAELRNEYRSRGLDRVEDTFVLYRIVGNDLYPRHEKGQSRENLRFILKNEPQLEGCEKRYIVNRIIDPDEEAAVIGLLDEAGAAYDRLSFDRELYRRIGFDVERFSQSRVLASAALDDFDEVKRERLQLALYRLKNNYVMNNNGARNFALRDGRARAKWVLPFDGNCFVTKQAWQQIRATVTASPHLKYFVVPMTRVQSNADLLDDGFAPEPIEEPQILFRTDAQAAFNEDFCYGRRPKVELLWRLGVAGKWDAYRDDPWDMARAPAAPEARQLGVAGWVARLFSGMGHLEVQSTAGADSRYLSRAKAILSTLRRLDASLSGASAATTTSLREDTLHRQVEQQAQPPLDRLVNALTGAADDALLRGFPSVTDKTTEPPSGDRQDYWHPAPYWWPDPTTADGLPYVWRDGERVPGTRMYDPDSEKYDRTRLQRVFDDSFVLALASRFTGDGRYGAHAAGILERFFVDPRTRMNPHLKYGQVRMGHNGNLGQPSGLIEMKDLYFYLDAVRILERAAAIPEGARSAFRGWLGDYLQWLLTSPQGRAERGTLNNHGTCYDLQVAAVAAFLDRSDIVYETLARAQARIGEHFAPDGSQPHELARTTTAHYCCFNLQSWINLAELASRWGVDLWSYRTREGAGLAQGARWFVSHMGKPWPHQQIDAFDAKRFLPVWFAASGHIDLAAPAAVPASPLLAKPVFSPHHGIRPFWNLGAMDVECPATGAVADSLAGSGKPSRVERVR